MGGGVGAATATGNVGEGRGFENCHFSEKRQNRQLVQMLMAWGHGVDYTAVRDARTSPASQKKIDPKKAMLPMRRVFIAVEVAYVGNKCLPIG